MARLREWRFLSILAGLCTKLSAQMAAVPEARSWWSCLPHHLQRLHRLGLLAMAQGMGGIVRQEAEMRSARNARQAAAAEQMHEAAAAEAGRKLQQLKDKQELKPKEWKRNNSGKGAA